MHKQDELRHKIAALITEYAEHAYAPKAFIPGETPIPPSGKLLGETELQYLVDASLDGWLTTGRYNDRFEHRLAEYLGVKHVLTTNSGSSANLLAFSALTSPKLEEKALQAGDEVITVAAGFPTTVNPILQYGLVPVFVDIELSTYNIDVDKIEQAITPRTKAIILAHTLGNPFNIDAVRAITDKHDLWLIEDCCDALGSEYISLNQPQHNPKVGTFGDIGTLSFYPAHHITMGEGGAVFTNNGKLKIILESFRDWGRDCFCAPGEDNTCGKRFCWKLGDLPHGYDHKYVYSHLGYNLKITDMQAACGVAQLEKIDFFVQRRKENFTTLVNALSDCEEFLILPKATENSIPSWFGFPLTLKSTSPISRVELLEALAEKKIGTRLLFAGNLTCQPYMKNRTFRVSDSLTNTDIVMKDTFWVGLQPALSEEMLHYSANTIANILQKSR